MKFPIQTKIKRSDICTMSFCLILLAGRIFGQEVEVDQAFDDCDQKNKLTVQGQSIPIGVTTRVALPSMTNEVIWFCAGDRNRSASDFFFNLVKIRRQASTDEFKVEFLKLTDKPDPNAPDLVKVGATKDACGKSRHVRFGDSLVRAGESKLVGLGSARNQLDWFCVPPDGKCPPSDVCDEHSANSIAFDFVRLERAQNGAMNWIFYRRKNSVPPNEPAVPDFVRNASGNIRVGISTPLGKSEKVLPERGLKSALDRAYLASINLIRDLVEAELNAGGKAAAKFGGTFQLAETRISRVSENELRTAAVGDAPSLKYVAHGNSAKISFKISGAPQANFNVTFDIDIEVGLRLNPLDRPPRALTAAVRIGHAEIEGSGVAGNLVQEVLKNKLREAKTQANNTFMDFREEVNEFFEKNFPDVPANVAKAEVSVTPAGTMRFCLRVLGAPGCQFGGGPEKPVRPAVLDSATDLCGEGRIWLRDAALKRYVSVAKGQKNILVEVESREFPWFCGGSQGPEQDESATGPLGTYLVSVSRAASGKIDWKFMSWH